MQYAAHVRAQKRHSQFWSPGKRPEPETALRSPRHPSLRGISSAKTPPSLLRKSERPGAMPRCPARGRPRPAPAAALQPQTRRPSSDGRGARAGSPGTVPRSGRGAPPQDVCSAHLAGSDLGSGFRPPLPSPQGPPLTAPGPRPPPCPEPPQAHLHPKL